jgi:hypothetical protein
MVTGRSRLMISTGSPDGATVTLKALVQVSMR